MPFSLSLQRSIVFITISFLAGGAHAQRHSLSIPAMGPPGSNTYARYTPFACGLASTRIGAFAAGERRLTWRNRWPATAATRVADSVADDSVRRVAKDEVRKCLAQHPVARTRTEYLLGLGIAWLSADDDVQASVIFHTLMQQMAHAPVAERAFALQQIVNAYAGYGGVRFDTALVFMRELDALGKDAAGFRLTARNTLYGVAALMDSMPLMTEHALAGFTLQETMTGDAQREWVYPILTAVVNRADAEARQRNYKSAIDRLTKAYAEFQSVDAGLTGAIIGGALSVTTPLGKTVPSLKATVAFDADHPTPMTTPPVVPATGRVTLLVRGAFPFFMKENYPFYQTICELHEKFGSAIDIVVLDQMTGTKGPTKVSRAEEEPLFEEFYHTYLRMKFPLVIYDRAVTGRRDDGVVFREANPNDLGMFVLVNKRGEFKNISNGINRMRWMHLVEEALAE
jgi:hypothetical protein